MNCNRFNLILKEQMGIELLSERNIECMITNGFKNKPSRMCVIRNLIMGYCVGRMHHAQELITL